MKKMIAIVVTLLMAGAGGYAYWLQSPHRALMQIRTAVQEHDTTLFRARVDLDSLVAHLVDDVAAEALDTLPGQSEGMAALGSALGRGFVELLKPQIVAQVRATVLEYIARPREAATGTSGAASGGQPQASAGPAVTQGGNAASSSPGKPSAAKQHPLLGDIAAKARDAEKQLRDASLVGIRQEGALATATVRVRPEGATQDILVDLLMRKTEGGWQVVQCSNARDVFRAIRQEQDRLHAAEVAAVEKENEALRAAMLQHVTIDQQAAAVSKGDMALDAKLIVQVQGRNVGSKTLQRVVYACTVTGDKNASTTVMLRDDGAVATGAPLGGTWTKSLNPFMEADAKVLAATSLAVVCAPSELAFADGSVMALKELPR